MKDEKVNYFLYETIRCLASVGKTPADVRWCGVINHEKYDKDGKPVIVNVSFSWDVFVSIANLNYDNGFGCAYIPTSFYIVGDDWWLERGEYDGSDWWEFKTMPVQPPLGTLQDLIQS